MTLLSRRISLLILLKGLLKVIGLHLAMKKLSRRISLLVPLKDLLKVIGLYLAMKKLSLTHVNLTLLQMGHLPLPQ
jgi:hypothetical protein